MTLQELRFQGYKDIIWFVIQFRSQEDPFGALIPTLYCERNITLRLIVVSRQ